MTIFFRATANKFLVAVTILLIGVTFVEKSYGAQTCPAIFSQLETLPIAPGSSEVRNEFSYGLESEYIVTSPEHPILGYYRSSVVSERRWQKYDESQKWRRFQGAVKRFGRMWTALSHRYGLVQMVRLGSAPPTLPPRMSIEAHGTVEISGIVRSSVASIEELYLNDLVPSFGPGAIQGHVVWPKAWHRGGKISLAGYVLYQGDRATLSALEQGYSRYIADSKKIPAAFLVHYALGPHSDGAKKFLLEVDQKLSQSQKIGSGDYYRMVNGPAPRDDVYPNDRVGIELRQFSYRPQALFEEMRNLTELVASGEINQFKFYLDADTLNSQLTQQASVFGGELSPKDWRDFFDEVGRYLRAQSNFPITGGSTFQIRFLIPLRNWEQNPVLNKLPQSHQLSVRQRIEKARSYYIKEVEFLIGSNLPMEEKITHLRVAIARWASEVNLSSYF